MGQDTVGREELYDFVMKRLVGPAGGENEQVDGRLDLQYMMGVLFPMDMRTTDLSSGETNEDTDFGQSDSGDSAFGADADDPLSTAFQVLPSAMGMSLAISAGTELEIHTCAGVYQEVKTSKQDKGDKKRKQKARAWKRSDARDKPVKYIPGKSEQHDVLGERAKLGIQCRPLTGGGHLLTISVTNSAKGEGRPAPGKTLYQVGIECRVLTGEIVPYVGEEPPTLSEEDRELRLAFSAMRPYAAGHGTSVDWALEEGRCLAARTTAMPLAHVWRPLFDRLVVENGTSEEFFDDFDIFGLRALAGCEEDWNTVSHRLGQLVGFYEKWIASQYELVVPGHFGEDKKRILDRCKKSAERMRTGIAVLGEDGQVRRAFALANRAMLMSMAHQRRIKGEIEDGPTGPFSLGEADTSLPAYDDMTNVAWRPFQLAFMLQLIPSLVDPNHEDRDIVDLIWFPTGGGKTEAYLLATAFELLRRRIVHGTKGLGTGVINRYTYRFLTADQFQRTASVICALEMLRQDDETGDLGGKSFSLGLYVGGDATPNKLSDDDNGAADWLNTLYQSPVPRAANRFPLESCPFCGTLLLPERRVIGDEETGDVDKAYYGFLGTSSNFRTRCPEEDCPFHESLPVVFIDDLLFRDPPSFVIGTIDKFALVPWNPSAGKLLGSSTNNMPPSLVIQDELHLISGPLGTLAGIYEAAFDTIIRRQGYGPAKYIASTATMRNARTQSRRLYARDGSIFPPPGIDATDSFFARADVGNVERSRMYVGIMGQGVKSTIAVTWAIAALMQGVEELGLTPDELDAYWTLVAYHNSRRELSRVVTATRDEIPTRMKVYAAGEASIRPILDVLELTANAEVPIPVARQLLGKRHAPPSDPAIDIVPCTNIISVGVDIDRLGIMLVNGQPKLSSEYIQATSRIGRGKVPGVVFTCLAPTKPRDRSHYESFRDYHEKFYTFVEPTSVTPGAIPALRRAVHAGLVAVVRHGTGLRDNGKAAVFDPSSSEVAGVIKEFEERLVGAYGDPSETEERQRIRDAIGERVSEWSEWASRHQNLKYVSRSKGIPALLVRFGYKRPLDTGWHTLQSMRHVDSEVELEVR